MPRRDLEGLVEIDALDQAEAADLVLRLGERTVRQQDLVRAQLDRGRVVGGTEAESATQHAAPGHLRAPVVAARHLLGRDGGVRRSAGDVAAQHQQVLHGYESAAPGQAARIVHSAVARTTPSPLVAQCRPAAASRLPLRRRSSHRSRPASAVKPTLARIASTWPAIPAPKTVAAAALAPVSRKEGSTCQRPKSGDDETPAHPAPRCRVTRPRRTPRDATSSSRTVPSGMTTRAASNAAPGCRGYRTP